MNRLIPAVRADANTAQADSYVIFGGAIGFERIPPVGLRQAFVRGENLSDETYTASVFINGSGGRISDPGCPRTGRSGHRSASRRNVRVLETDPDDKAAEVDRLGPSAPDSDRPLRIRPSAPCASWFEVSRPRPGHWAMPTPAGTRCVGSTRSPHPAIGWVANPPRPITAPNPRRCPPRRRVRRSVDTRPCGPGANDGWSCEQDP